MQFVAGLHDGHTWFYDNWLDRNYGQPVGFIAYPIDGKWIVIRSALSGVKVGDVITRIDNTAIGDFYATNRKYVSASSDRDSGVSFFDTPAIFPERFTVSLDDGRQIVIDRAQDTKTDSERPKTHGRWLVPNAIAYIQVPNFHEIDTQAQALHYLRDFHAANAVILDVRGNPGLGSTAALKAALITSPYKSWMASSSLTGGVLLRDYSAEHSGESDLTTSGALVTPADPIYSGHLFLLVDRGCTCACEDFVMPFKIAKRAVLVGETTAGTFSSTKFTTFDNGMLLNVTSIRHVFPDGSRFEGVGITADVETHITPEDLKQGRDVALNKALELAEKGAPE